VQETNLETLMAESDIISLHIPLTAETKELVNAAFIKNCKPGFVLINTSRGKNVNMGDVLTALQSGYMRGACLDVFPVEPPLSGPDDLRANFEMLCKLDNVVLTPHVAGWTVESKRKISEVLLRKIRAIGVPH
jgi:D-3-phosphoglycerate dehydrogenase